MRGSCAKSLVPPSLSSHGTKVGHIHTGRSNGTDSTSISVLDNCRVKYKLVVLTALWSLGWLSGEEVDSCILTETVVTNPFANNYKLTIYM